MYKMMEGPSLTPIQAELVNTHKGAVVKSCGAERLCCISIIELNASEPLQTCRKLIDDTEIAGRDSLAKARCSILPVCWLHGIRHGDGNTVIQAYIWNMGGCCNDEPKAQQEFCTSGRLFNKSFTVHTAAQSRLSQEKHYRASDAFIVVMIVRESGKEQRDAVIQLKLL
jgi:hypothetical protein